MPKLQPDFSLQSVQYFNIKTFSVIYLAPAHIKSLFVTLVDQVYTVMNDFLLALMVLATWMDGRML